MTLSALRRDPAVSRARALIHEQDADTVREQVELAQIPAPPLQEARRGEAVRERFIAAGLREVSVDAAGNVLGWLAGTEPRPSGAVIVSAHLDTVFPAETDLTVREENGRISVPGITDNCRGLAAMLRIARVLSAVEMRTARPVLFVATVGEEGTGDLKGVKHLFREGSPFREAAGFFSLDGAGTRRIIHRAVGSRRLRMRFRGAGGHSWADWGTPNPLHAMAAAIGRAAAHPLPVTPRTTFTAARTGGGTSVNAIPEGCWVELDLRSEGPDALRAVEAAVREHTARAVAEENGRWPEKEPVTVETEVIGDRPSGEIPADADIVRAAMAATRAVGAEPELASSSTDANVPISLGIPAVTIGAGGKSGGIHTMEEWFRNEEGARGIERALLAVLLEAGYPDSTTE